MCVVPVLVRISPPGSAALENWLVAASLPVDGILARGKAKRVHAVLVDAFVHHVVKPESFCNTTAVNTTHNARRAGKKKGPRSLCLRQCRVVLLLHSSTTRT